MPKIQFNATLESGGDGGVYFTLPLKESSKFGVRGRVPVTGTINGYAFRSSIFPIGDGTHYMAVNKTVREGAKVAVGDRVKIVMETDTAPRTVNVPPDLDKALSKSKAARTRFDSLSYTHRKEYAEWIESAKRPETRARRVEVVLARLTAE
ncbi:MAG TPA: YdeI/OmpD-associated family protein [Pyrinomonadaceae bacterium]|jgi:hypothetical protein